MLRNLQSTAAWALVCATLGTGLFAGAEDWPTYRGPRRNCTSEEKGLLDTWPEAGPKLLWETKLEPGNSSPVVSQGRVFCLGRKGEKGWNHPATNKPEGNVFLYCLDRTDGHVIWTHEMPVYRETDNAAMNTAAVDGDRVYARGGNGDVHCVSFKDGSLIWRWPKDDEVLKTRAGYMSTIFTPDVLISGDLAIFCDLGAGYNCGKNLLAVNKMTGEPVWQFKRSISVAYDTLKPEMMSVDGKSYLLVDHHALDPVTGKVVYDWGSPELAALNTVASIRGGETGFIGYANAVVDNVAYMNFCRKGPDPAPDAGQPAAENGKKAKVSLERGILALRFEHDSAGTLTARKTWEWLGERGSWVNSPVVGSGVLFANLGKMGDDVVCLDSATGKECWKTVMHKLPNVHALYSEPLHAEGKIFLSTTDLYMIAADPKAFRVLGKAPLRGTAGSAGGGGVYHAPALSDGHLFARNNLGTVFCFDIRKAADESGKK